ncbi:MAG: tRNA pseudouridine(55) synthase TruB [Dehalococcoidia bacterium]
MSGEGPEGILLIDKPAGWTSHDVVAKARRLTRQRRIGHTGTLDPMATGLLVLCLGRATRLVEYLTAHDKRYEGEIVLGVSTDTDDAEGTTTARAPVPPIDGATIEMLEARFTGALLQRPPAYSAVKVEGKRAYAVARGGGELELAARPVTVHSLALTDLGGGRLAIRVHCGPGTYIRSLARDIGAALGCGAHLAALRRTSSGAFDVADAFTLGELERICANGRLQDALLPNDEGLAGMDAALLDADSAARFATGREVACDAAPSECVRVFDAAGALAGIGAIAPEGGLRPLKVLQFAPGRLMSEPDSAQD